MKLVDFLWKGEVEARRKWWVWGKKEVKEGEEIEIFIAKHSFDKLTWKKKRELWRFIGPRTLTTQLTVTNNSTIFHTHSIKYQFYWESYLIQDRGWDLFPFDFQTASSHETIVALKLVCVYSYSSDEIHREMHREREREKSGLKPND